MSRGVEWMVARLTGGVRLGRLMLWPPAPIIILYVRRVELASFLFCESVCLRIVESPLRESIAAARK